MCVRKRIVREVRLIQTHEKVENFWFARSECFFLSCFVGVHVVNVQRKELTCAPP